LANRNLKGDVNVQFEEPTSRINLDSGSSVKTLFGRISKWLKDLKAVAFSGSYTDLSDKPTIPLATAVKGNSETTYRTGNVNLTPANIGAATSTQGAKADSAVQTIQMNGSTVTKTSGTVNLGTVITAHQDISGKADKSATVSTIAYDTTNKKLTKTINGTTSDVVTTAQLKTDMALSKSDVGLGNVGNYKAVSTVASQGLTDTEKSNARANIGAGTSSFSGSYNDLSNKPTIPAAVAVKGNAETSYRTGNVNLTPANIGLGNVNNTSDANKPISTAAQAALDKQQAQVNAALKQTGYNLLEITQPSQTINGVTFTVDKAAGTITVNGTATAAAWFTLCNPSLPAGNYTLSGCPPNGSLGTYALVLYYDESSHQAVDTGEGNTFSTGATEARLVIRLASGTTLSNLVFKPMIVPAELAGVPFQPYAKSNAELTSGKLDVTGNADTPYDQLPDHFELWTSPGAAASNGNLWIKMRSYSTSVDSFLLLANDDTLQYFGIEKDNFVVQTKDANSYYEFKDDGIYLNGTRIAP
jgi:hypothetical protein